MVIGPGRDGITCIIILTDNELLPTKFNSPKILVFRKGDSTNRELRVVKELGKLASSELLRSEPVPDCNFSEIGSLDNPLHQHADGTWWWYEETWSLENGPYETEEIGQAALQEYCDTVLAERKDLTDEPEISEDES